MLTPWLTALGGTVKGIGSSSGVRSGVPVHGEEDLVEPLPEADALLMILPGDQATMHALNKERLGLL
jgi:phosphoglycerate dehydrogenase-like enzyme